MYYEVAIVEVPTEEDAKKGAVEKIVLPVTPVIAADPQSAAVNVAIEHAEKLAGVKRERMSVLVRPFIKVK